MGNTVDISPTAAVAGINSRAKGSRFGHFLSSLRPNRAMPQTPPQIPSNYSDYQVRDGAWGTPNEPLAAKGSTQDVWNKRREGMAKGLQWH